MSPDHQTIDPIAHGSNDVAFRNGRWILIGQGAVALVLGGWILLASGLAGWQPAAVLGMHPTWLQGAILVLMAAGSVAVARSRRAGTIFVATQTITFLLLFAIAAAVRHSGGWQLLFGYGAADSFCFLGLAIAGLIMVMWMFPRALADPEWPTNVMQESEGQPRRDEADAPPPQWRAPSRRPAQSGDRLATGTTRQAAAWVGTAVAVAASAALLRKLRRR